MKAILVMDMPSSCSECPCCYIPRCEVLVKSLKTSEIYERKPDWCPLKPMPSKKEEWIKISGTSKGVHGVKKNGFNTGYNACIDVLGGSE